MVSMGTPAMPGRGAPVPLMDESNRCETGASPSRHGTVPPVQTGETVSRVAIQTSAEALGRKSKPTMTVRIRRIHRPDGPQRRDRLAALLVDIATLSAPSSGVPS